MEPWETNNSLSVEEWLAFLPTNEPVDQIDNIESTCGTLVSKKLRRRSKLLTTLLKRLEHNKVRTRGSCCLLNMTIRAKGLLANILAGQEEATMDTLHVSPNALRLLVRKIGIKRPGWGVKIEAIIFLFWLASGFSYKAISSELDIPRSTMYRAVQKTLAALQKVIFSEINFPSEDEIPEIIDGFSNLTDYNSPCVGAMTSKSISGCYPYSSYQLRVQYVTDHTNIILHLFISSSDVDPFSRSTIFKQYTYPPPGHFLTSINEYPSRNTHITILTPYQHPRCTMERDFNTFLDRAQAVAENTVGMMEARWPLIFNNPEELHLPGTKCLQVMVACSVIHNVCLRAGDTSFRDAKRVSVVCEERKCVENASRDMVCKFLHMDLVKKGKRKPMFRIPY